MKLYFIVNILCIFAMCEDNSKDNKLLVLEKKIKMVEYTSKQLCSINNIDNDTLDDLSMFSIGSITKLFTIISILLLHQNKKINIYDNIGKYIDNKHIENLKIIDIINHCSGLKRMYNGTSYRKNKIKYTSATDVYNKWNDNDMIDKKYIGIKLYSNMGFQILGVLIEKISNKVYIDFVKKYILMPLDMNNTGIDNENIILYNNRYEKLNESEKLEKCFASSAGELNSCVKDLIKFSKFITLLDEHSLKLLCSFNVCTIHNNNITIRHDGRIFGGECIYKIIYDCNYKFNDIYISLKTIV